MSIKDLKRQKQIGKLRKTKTRNMEVALDFMGNYEETPEGSKFIIVVLDHISANPTLKIVNNRTFSTVEKFSGEYNTDQGIPEI